MADEPTLLHALEVAERACDEVMEIIRSAPDMTDRLHIAAKLSAIFRDRGDEIARMRHAEAARLWETGNLSLAGVAACIGVSKARADQIIKAHKKHQGRPAAAGKQPRVRPLSSPAAPPAPPVPVLPETEIGQTPITALYRLYDLTGTLLYIGVTDDLKARFDRHREEKLWWPQVARKTVAWYGKRKDAFAAETAAIANEHPIHNVVGSRRESQAS